MQHLYKGPKREACFHRLAFAFQTPVRFFALIELNHMLHRLCGPPSIPLSFNLAIVLPRRSTYSLAAALKGSSLQHLVLIVYSVDYQGI